MTKKLEKELNKLLPKQWKVKGKDFKLKEKSFFEIGEFESKYRFEFNVERILTNEELLEKAKRDLNDEKRIIIEDMAKLAKFAKQQKDLPDEIADIVNNYFWSLI